MNMTMTMTMQWQDVFEIPAIFPAPFTKLLTAFIDPFTVSSNTKPVKNVFKRLKKLKFHHIKKNCLVF
jgi:hypothetical protein